MRVLWIINRPILGTCGTKQNESSGSWLEAAYYQTKDLEGIDYYIAAASTTVSVLQDYSEEGNHFYLVPSKVCEESKKEWEKLKKLCKPSIVVIWGTEKPHALMASKVFYDVPKVVYIQGVISKIAQNYTGEIPFWTRFKYLSPKDIVKHTGIDYELKRLHKQAEIEQEILSMAYGAIVENDWCEYQIKSIAPNVKVFRSLLPIKDDFFETNWDISKIKRHTIFTNACAAPHKGHHVLYQALSKVVKKYPDTQLVVPGFCEVGTSFNKRIRQSGYVNYLSDIIRKNSLEQNVVFSGPLSSKQVAAQLATSHIFVMPSFIENHSSSLIEAMIVGCPSISAFVGGVASVAEHSKNVFFYNSNDPETLAGYIIRLFENDTLLRKISDNSKLIREIRRVDLKTDFINIYNTVGNNNV